MGFSYSNVAAASNSLTNIKQPFLKSDVGFGKFHTYVEDEEGNRYYSNSSIVLKSDSIRKLKSMKNLPTFDHGFIGYLLTAVFDEEILKNISVAGKPAHTALEEAKLKYIEGWFGKEWSKP